MLLSLLNIFELIFKYISATQCKSRYAQILQGTLRMALLSASLQDQAMAKRDGARTQKPSLPAVFSAVLRMRERR
jgi:hypothetical protein